MGILLNRINGSLIGRVQWATVDPYSWMIVVDLVVSTIMMVFSLAVMSNSDIC